jgi:hypothetical protein
MMRLVLQFTRRSELDFWFQDAECTYIFLTIVQSLSNECVMVQAKYVC